MAKNPFKKAPTPAPVVEAAPAPAPEVPAPVMDVAPVMDAAPAQEPPKAQEPTKAQPLMVKAVHGLMVDSVTAKEYTQVPVEVPALTNWMKAQIAAGKMEVVGA